ncbi:beta-1,3-galactosyltransferase 1-like [Lytechinus pictus]|uniref:beta-1,3-galactosyltransferase 1-like n=1 Tax=Lytechinus pictus TaxID=7653 RepID=UPI0030B9D515
MASEKSKFLFLFLVHLLSVSSTVYFLWTTSFQGYIESKEIEREINSTKIHRLISNNSTGIHSIGGKTEVLLGWRRNINWESAVHLHEYRYLINPEDRCKNSRNITLLILIKTRTSSKKNRDFIRETYGEAVVRYNVSVRILFLTGLTENSTVQSMLQQEADIHKDILQGHFQDTYHNLTVKLVIGFKWATTFCRNNNYVMSTDDDTLVDVVDLVNDLEVDASTVLPSKFVLAEPAVGWHPIRNSNSKWYTPPELYSAKSWPPFPRGYAYIVSRDVAEQLDRASQKIAPPVPWDDVYCGMLLKYLGLEMNDIRSWFKSRHGHKRRMHPLKAEDHYVTKMTSKAHWRAIEQRYNYTRINASTGR